MRTILEEDEYVLVYLLDSTLESTRVSHLFKEINVSLDYAIVNKRKVKCIKDSQIKLLLELVKKKKEKRDNAYLFCWERLVNKLNTRIKLAKEWHINKYENFYDWENL